MDETTLNERFPKSYKENPALECILTDDQGNIFNIDQEHGNF